MASTRHEADGSRTATPGCAMPHGQSAIVGEGGVQSTGVEASIKRVVKVIAEGETFGGCSGGIR
jgi:hypothetical protein